MSILNKLIGRGGSDDVPQAASGNTGEPSSLPTNHQQYGVCRYCQRKVKKGVWHQCQPMRDQRKAARRVEFDDEGDDFFVSFLIAYTTDNWGLGYVGGGNMMGAILGDALRDDGFEDDIEPDMIVQPAGEDAFLDSDRDAHMGDDGLEDPVIEIDPDEGAGEEPAPEVVAELADSCPDVDGTDGDSSDSY